MDFCFFIIKLNKLDFPELGGPVRAILVPVVINSYLFPFSTTFFISLDIFFISVLISIFSGTPSSSEKSIAASILDKVFNNTISP